MSTTVNRQLAEPTFDDEPLVDFDATTETLPATETREATRAGKPKASHNRESAIGSFLKDKWVELLLGALLIPLFWLVVGMNRELGELKTESRENQARTERLQQQLDRTEDRLREEIEKLHARIDEARPAAEAAPAKRR